jgi:hypothetical protein
VRISAGNSSVEQVATVERGRRLLVEMALPPATHMLTVETVPPGAEIFLDGHLQMGQSPLTVRVDQDFHEIRAEKQGYRTMVRALKPEDAAATLSLPLEPERIPRGLLWIDANRAASVFIDGVDTGMTTPTIGIRVLPGKHDVTLRDASGQRGPSVQLELKQGETRHLTLDFVEEAK